MSRARGSLRKACLLAIVPALALTLLFHLLAAGRLDAPTVLDWFGTPISKLLMFAVATLDGPVGAVQAFLVGVGFDIVVFLNYWLVFVTFLAGTSIGRAGVAFVWPGLPPFLDPRLTRVAVSTIDPFCANESFVGRSQEIDSVIDRVNEAPGFRWIPIVGRMGVGKTRLALEAMRILRAQGWEVGLLEPGRWESDLRAARFRKRCCILIDDYEKRGGSLWETLISLAENPSSTRVRVLLTDFTDAVVPRYLEAFQRERMADTRGATIHVGELSDAAVAELDPDYRGAERRPLLVKLGENPWPELSRRSAERIDRAHSLLGSDGPRLLAFAALAAPVDAAVARRIAPGATSLAALSQLFDGEPVNRLRANIPPIAPEMLGHEILLQWASDRTEAEIAILSEAVESNPQTALRAILAIARERPWITQEIDEEDAERTPYVAALHAIVKLNLEAWREAARVRAQACLDEGENQSSPNERYDDANAMLRLWPDLADARLAMVNALRGMIHVQGSWQQQYAERGETPNWAEAKKLLGWLAAATNREPALLDEGSLAYRCFSSHLSTANSKLADALFTEMPAVMDLVQEIESNLEIDSLGSAYLENAASLFNNMASALVEDAVARSTEPEEPEPWRNFDSAFAVLQRLSRRRDLVEAAAESVGDALRNVYVTLYDLDKLKKCELPAGSAERARDCRWLLEQLALRFSGNRALNRMLADSVGMALALRGALARAQRDPLSLSDRERLFETLRRIARDHSQHIEVLAAVAIARVDDLYNFTPHAGTDLADHPMLVELRAALDLVDGLLTEESGPEVFASAAEAWRATLYLIVSEERCREMTNGAFMDTVLGRIHALIRDPRFTPALGRAFCTPLGNASIRFGDYGNPSDRKMDAGKFRRVVMDLCALSHLFPSEPEIAETLLGLIISAEIVARQTSLSDLSQILRKQLANLGLFHPNSTTIQGLLENYGPSFTYRNQISKAGAQKEVDSEAKRAIARHL